MKNRTLKISGYEFGRDIHIQYFDMGLILRKQEAEKKWLMLFNAESDTATIDHGMPEWYSKLAILVEAISKNKVHKREIECHKNCAPTLRIAAEQYCLTKTESHRSSWLKARKYYYEFLLSQKPNEAERLQLEQALKYIQQLIENDDGGTTEYLYHDGIVYETHYNLTSFEKFSSHENRKWLVYYTTDGKVYLDKTSPKWYRKIASLSEEVYMGQKYPELLAGYDTPDNDHFDATVEAMIIEKFTSAQTRKNYIEARIQLFELIRDAKLNTIPGIQIALDYLLERQKTET